MTAIRDICECLASLLSQPGESNDHRLGGQGLHARGRPEKQKEWLSIWIDGEYGLGLIALTAIVSRRGQHIEHETLVCLSEGLRGAFEAETSQLIRAAAHSCLTLLVDLALWENKRQTLQRYFDAGLLPALSKCGTFFVRAASSIAALDRLPRSVDCR